MSLGLKSIDSMEFAVKDIGPNQSLLERWGFKKLGEGKSQDVHSVLMAQGKVRFLLSQGLSDISYATKFVEKHGDGICDIAFEVDDANAAFEKVTARGAKESVEPSSSNVGEGQLTRGTISMFGDVTHSFISRKNTDLFNAAIPVQIDESHKGVGIFATDHITCNVAQGDMEKWAQFFQDVFEFKNTRFFDISTGRTGLLSKVMENEEGNIKIPFNEPTGKKSQIQEYLDINNGPGVQHLALNTRDILETMPMIRKTGQEFLDVPDTYYDEVPKRVPDLKEDLGLLKAQRILTDGDNSGYLLQIFSQNVVGPFFFEVIQRRGNEGFGEGNFKALFEAIERDQEKRGVL